MSAELFRKMLDQTSVKVIGLCKGVSQFQGKTKMYSSVDLEVKGSKQLVNIKLPDIFDHAKYPEYEVVSVYCQVKPSFDKKAIELHAL